MSRHCAASAAQRTQMKTEQFHVGGQLIDYVEQHKCLGVTLHEVTLWKADMAVRESRASRSTGLMQSCLASLQATKSICLAFRMHDVCVRTVETYGAAMWATSYCCSDPARVVQNGLEKLQLQFMRRWCKLRQNVPVWAIFAELGRLPLHYFWWREIVRFFNRVAVLPDGNIWRAIMTDNLTWQHANAKCWSAQVRAFLQGITFSTGALELVELQEEFVMHLLLQRYSSVWDCLESLPRLASARVQLCTYHAWMHRGQWLDRPGYLFLRLSYRKSYTFIRFKLGCHGLAIVTGRWHDVPRAQRLCTRCDMHALDDERHLVFECPAFEGLRREFRQLFGRQVGYDMRRFFAHKDQSAVVLYILRCLDSIAA